MSFDNSARSGKPKESEPPASTMPADIARARARMGVDATATLDADSIEWLCGPRSLKAKDWLFGNEKGATRSIVSRPPPRLKS